jgi:signal transduction histidine kinase
VAVRVKGTGLGLFVVRSVIKRHGGKVFAASEGPGRGSTFTVQLPVLPPS